MKNRGMGPFVEDVGFRVDLVFYHVQSVFREGCCPIMNQLVN